MGMMHVDYCLNYNNKLLHINYLKIVMVYSIKLYVFWMMLVNIVFSDELLLYNYANECIT